VHVSGFRVRRYAPSRNDESYTSSNTFAAACISAKR